MFVLEGTTHPRAIVVMLEYLAQRQENKKNEQHVGDLSHKQENPSF
jgi:hypothetical protein